MAVPCLLSWGKEKIWLLPPRAMLGFVLELHTAAGPRVDAAVLGLGRGRQWFEHKSECFKSSCQGSVRTKGRAALPPSSPSPLAGSPHRCLHALKVGWKVCWAKAEEEEEQSRMAFLSHDISMLRLFETFLENTPQLTLLLYIILRTNKAEPSQGEGSGARGGGLRGCRPEVRAGLGGTDQMGCAGAAGPSRTLSLLEVSFFSHIAPSLGVTHRRVDPCPALACPHELCWAWGGRVEAGGPLWSFPYMPQERLRVRREIRSPLGSGEMPLWMWAEGGAQAAEEVLRCPSWGGEQVLLQ